MLHPISHQIKHSQPLAKTLIPLQNPFISTATSSLLFPITQFSYREINNNRIARRVGSTIKAVSTPVTSTRVKAVVIVTPTVGGFLSNLVTHGVDDITDLLGKSILLELLSAELDPKTGLEKTRIKGYAHKKGLQKDGEVKYECNFVIPEEFGEIGGVLVENEHQNEMFISNISFSGFPIGPTNVSCDSWVPSKFKTARKRIFFANKSYLPSQTPSGLKIWRQRELEELRGDGKGVRKKGERVFDYDVYNDLGNPDKSTELKRPILGGNKEFPYPRRCRTGRPRSKKDPLSESRSSDVYVPRDEEFTEVKNTSFSAKTVASVLHAVVPALEIAVINPDLGFPLFSHIDSLFDEGVQIADLPEKNFQNLLPRILKKINDLKGNVLQFETPALLERDKFSWFRDEEFSRQTLAGLNPCAIQLVTEWPLMSKLDPKIYGPPESVITKELVEREIRGFMTVSEAVKQKRLFMLDYHDLLLPYVNRVREIKGLTLYGSRTLFFLTPNGTLRPIAIELTRPPVGDKPKWSEAFFPTWDATGCWLWRLAKTHALSHDSGYHQLVSHWLRTHCCTEPYIIASYRQLSAMHPIFRLLHPHFRYTMEINALARKSLINAGGNIETNFSPGKYSIELSAVAYKEWQFDLQALPADLINRGMAVEDPNSPHGLKLTIEDYPYANDGLILWDTIKQWVSDYVNHYYPDPTLITSDTEIQNWWNEIINVGHGDKKNEPWWPKLETPEDLIGILTTMIWVTSGHHSAVNFGQYGYAGYFPNHPTLTRKKMPTEDPLPGELENFIKKPEFALLQTFPSKIQAMTVMAVLDVLSNHSVDEEYIGDVIEPSWEEDPVIKAAFERFSGSLKRFEGIIDGRNADWDLKNRCGAGVVPYELLKPYSEPGVTGKGVPNSISI